MSIINLFRQCTSLVSLPDISKWNISNVKDMSCIFDGSNSLISLPDIFKRDNSKITNLSYLFSKCESLVSGILLMLKIGLECSMNVIHLFIFLIYQNGIFQMLLISVICFMNVNH